MELLFDLDLDGSYSEFQFRQFLYIYRNLYREIYSINSRLKNDEGKKDIEINKLQEELNIVKQKLLIQEHSVNVLKSKINNKKLTFFERLTGKIKF